MTNYKLYCNSADRRGYSGTAFLSKKNPVEVSNDIQIAEHDSEGRVQCVSFKNYYVVNVYQPNSGQKLDKLNYRKKWDADFLSYIKELEKTKPVIICGDFNVAHAQIDLKNAKSNYNKTAGYTQIEIDGMTNLLQSGFIDVFRHFYPEKETYTFWSYRFSARKKNIGWRIDYFLISKTLLSKVKSIQIHTDIYGSDHCPVELNIEELD